MTGLVLSNVDVQYGALAPALRDVSLTVAEGEIVAVLGPNGAGKTTMLRAVSGLLAGDRGRVTRGEIAWRGTPLRGLDPADIVRLGVLQVLEGRHVFTHLSVEQNLLAGGHVRGPLSRARAALPAVLDLFPPLAPLRRMTAGNLSGGEQQMLAIARAIMADPRLLILDEPSLGLAPIKVREILQILVRANAERGLTVLLVEQNAHAALSLAHRAYVLDGGRIALEGSAERLRLDAKVSATYLGMADSDPGAGEQPPYADVDVGPPARWFAGTRECPPAS
jgi:branched-chain amino acid transport system ATP-binding protein